MLASLLSPRQESRDQATTWGDWGEERQTWAGTNVTTQSSMQLLTVYGCARFITDGIATLPVDVLRKSPDGSPVPVEPPPWVTQPTVDLAYIPWATQILLSLLLAGNAWLWRSYAGGVLDQLIPLDPLSVGVYRDPGKRRTVTVNGRPVDPANLVHIPAMMFANAEVGMSPVEAARQTIGAGLAAQEYSARFFAQDATPAGVIEVPGEMVPEKATEMARMWRRKHSGKSKVGLPGVLQGGATWKSTGVTNEQAQFLETRSYTAAEIAGQMFLIDPSEMGLPVNGTSLTYANLTERNAHKVQVTFLPWIVRIEHAMSSLLPPGQYAKINVSGLLRGDIAARFAAYGVGIDKQFMTPNEARALEDWPPLPGGDVVVPFKESKITVG